MFNRYLQAAMRRAHYELLADEGKIYGEIPALPGVYVTADTLETCREELAEVLEEWILFRIAGHLPIPVLEGIDLTIWEVA